MKGQTQIGQGNIHNKLIGLRKQLGNRDIYVLLRVCKKSFKIYEVYTYKLNGDLDLDAADPENISLWHNKNKHLRNNALKLPMDYLG